MAGSNFPNFKVTHHIHAMPADDRIDGTNRKSADRACGACGIYLTNHHTSDPPWRIAAASVRAAARSPPKMKRVSIRAPHILSILPHANRPQMGQNPSMDAGCSSSTRIHAMASRITNAIHQIKLNQMASPNFPNFKVTHMPMIGLVGSDQWDRW